MQRQRPKVEELDRHPKQPAGDNVLCPMLTERVARLKDSVAHSALLSNRLEEVIRRNRRKRPVQALVEEDLEPVRAGFERATVSRQQPSFIIGAGIGGSGEVAGWNIHPPYSTCANPRLSASLAASGAVAKSCARGNSFG